MDRIGNLPVPVPDLQRGLSLRDVVFILFRRRWFILAVSLPIIIIGGVSLFQQTGTYTAASRAVVELQKVELPQWNTTLRNVDYDRELSTLFNIAMSVPVAERAAESLADSFATIMSLDPDFTGEETLDDLSGYLVDGLEVSPVGESHILEFSFTAVEPRIALMGTGAMMDAFIWYHNSSRRNPKAVAFYEEQMSVVRAQIDSLHAARIEAQRAGGYTSVQDDIRHGAGQRADMENALMRVRVDRQALQREHTQLQVYLDRDPRDFPIGRDESTAESMVYLRNLVVRHEDELHSILSVHTAESVPARRQQVLLDQSLDRLRVEQIAYIESIGLQIESMLMREAALEAEIEMVIERTSSAPETYGKVSIIDTEIESLRRLFEDLQGKWGEVRMAELADERVSSVTAITAPQLVSVLSGGKTLVYFAILAGFALALGVVVGFVVEAVDHRIYTTRDVETHLKLPVLASIGEAEKM